MKPLGQRWLCNGGMPLAVTAVGAQTALVPSSIPVKQLSGRWGVSFGGPPRAKGNESQEDDEDGKEGRSFHGEVKTEGHHEALV